MKAQITSSSTVAWKLVKIEDHLQYLFGLLCSSIWILTARIMQISGMAASCPIASSLQKLYPEQTHLAR